MIIDLNNQVQDVKRTEKQSILKGQKRTQEYENIEEDIMHLRKKQYEESIKSKIENISRTLDEILSFQISSSNKYGLGFDKEKKPEYSCCTNQDGNKKKLCCCTHEPN